MIQILTDAGAEPAGRAISDALKREYGLARAPELVAVDAVWNREAEWDDLLLVVFQSSALPAAAVQYIQAFRAARETGGAIIPVSTKAEFRKPPDPLASIKAAEYDGTPAAAALIAKAAGVFLGLALRPKSQRIFVSYRATDGTALANSIFARLKADGFTPWLDEAEENLVIGDEVQDKIRAGVEAAAMVLLVDTPSAPASKWVNVEVDLANGQLVPVLPVVAGRERLSRFVQLQGLRRWALVKPDGLDQAPLSDAEWSGIRAEMDELLLSTFRRRMKILARATSAFEANGYQWQTLDDRLRMYRADKTTARLAKIVALSHCMVHDITYLPALRAYWDYLKSYKDVAAVNQKLCIYDRDLVLSPAEMAALSASLPGVNAILAHYSELDLLVSSNFAL